VSHIQAKYILLFLRARRVSSKRIHFDNIQTLWEAVLHLLVNEVEARLLKYIFPGHVRSCQTRVFGIEHDVRGAVHVVGAQIFFNHNEAAALITQRRLTATEECSEVRVAEVPEAPLAPYNVEARERIRHGRRVPDALEHLCVMRPCGVEVLQGPFEERHAFRPVRDSPPRVRALRGCARATAGKGLLDEVVYRFEEDDVGHEVKEDVGSNAANACADIEGARAARWRRNKRTKSGGDCAELWEQVEEEEAGTERVDAGERLEGAIRAIQERRRASTPEPNPPSTPSRLGG